MPTPPPRLSPARVVHLRRQLDALVASTDPAARLAADPLRFARGWADPADAEVAAVFASGLAFGRVAAFGPVIARVLDLARARGGPRAWIDSFDSRDARALDPIVYRWIRGPDLALLARSLRAVLRGGGTLGALAVAGWSGEARPQAAAGVLGAVVQPLRDAAQAIAGAEAHRDLPRGLRYLLPHPSSGSACKRWCMFLRWMVRAPGDGAAGVDLGLWRLPPAALVVPLDTHVHRISRFIGLTQRADASWRTAVEITGSLARLDPVDPARYDFALAHLGISGACRSAWVPDICGPCALRGVCAVAAPHSTPRPG